MKVTLDRIRELDYRSNEAYRALRTNISFCGEDIRVIAFTSATPNEGKSVVSFWLAKFFGEDEKKTLYIDADIRKSVLTARYGASRETKGLSHYLAGKAGIEEIICQSNLNNVDFVFTGPVVPNPPELLGTKRFTDLIAFAREQYEYVMIDCPPLGSVIDAAIIAKGCDGAVLVIESENVSYKLLQRVKKQLQQSGCRILGAVLNKVEVAGKGYGRYYGTYYGKYYGNYGEYGQESRENG